jgi:hypothetical protein
VQKKERGETRHSLLTQQALRTMTDAQKLRDIEIRNIANKYLNERPADNRTEEPLPADYEAFRDEAHGDVSDDEIRRFEEEWADLYDQMR